MSTRTRTRRRPNYAVRIEVLMRECGFNDADLAVAASLSPRTVAQIRCGRRASMRLGTAALLAGAFSRKLGRQVTAKQLLGVER